VFATFAAAAVRLRTFHLCALHNVARSETRLSAASSITFDAFDTLITRSVLRPSDAFLLVGSQLRQAGLSLLDPGTWAGLRTKAEQDCAQRAKPLEVTLSQIYSRLAELGGVDGRRQTEAMEVEASVELRISSPIAYMSALLQRTSAAGKRTAILSDTYLEKADRWHC
jgi:predicted HAD superfamily hydrolase